jgi:putative ABC transport system permease protein
MWLAIKLAYRNLIGAGLRTWLNVVVLSFSFVIIIWMKGLMTGWDHQAKLDMTHYEIGGGQYWHEAYDPYDPLTLFDSHAPIPDKVMAEIARGDMEPMLVVQGNIFPQGRMMAATIVGIRPEQNLFKLPAHSLDTLTDAIPVFVGAMMANTAKLSIGDRLTMRWRDANGTFDAAEIVISDIFYSNVPTAEGGKVYMALETLWEMTLLARSCYHPDISRSGSRTAAFDWLDNQNKTGSDQTGRRHDKNEKCGAVGAVWRIAFAGHAGHL